MGSRKNDETKGKYDPRNKLNDLTGKEWLKLTKSFWESKKCAEDRDAFAHPAPFLIKDIESLISMFTKKGMLVLDPFVGSGTTSIAAHNLNRRSIGIDLSREYFTLAKERFEKLGIAEDQHKYLVGDSKELIGTIGQVDYIVTSPPYHNILRNKSSGTRTDKSHKGYRSGARLGQEFYSDDPRDLGNQDSYDEFLSMLRSITTECFKALKPKKYMSIIISDFTVNRKEVCSQADVVRVFEECGFEFVGTIVLLQNTKPLYPFGYPYAFKINHMHQNIINFRRGK